MQSAIISETEWAIEILGPVNVSESLAVWREIMDEDKQKPDTALQTEEVMRRICKLENQMESVLFVVNVICLAALIYACYPTIENILFHKEKDEPKTE